MNLTNQIIAVTGANGFLGSAVSTQLTRLGAIARPMLRKPANDQYQFDLAGNIDPRALAGPIRAVIHCAWAMGQPESLNVEGTRRLFDECRRHNVQQIIFISSMAAHPDAQSNYGRGKFLVEQLAPQFAATVIKPGTIIGPGGVFAKARSMLRKLPMIPVPYYFSTSKHLQTVYVDDVVQAVIQTLDQKITGPLFVAEPAGVPLRDFYRGIAALDQLRRCFIPMPVLPALLAAKFAEAIHLHLPLTSDNLLGLRNLSNFDTAPTQNVLGTQFRGFWQSLAALAAAENRPAALATIQKMATA